MAALQGSSSGYEAIFIVAQYSELFPTDPQLATSVVLTALFGDFLRMVFVLAGLD